MRARLIFAALCMLAAAPAWAQDTGYSLMVHAYTMHPKETPWMQNKTPGLGLRHDASGWQAGTFCNSFSASKDNPEGGPYTAPGTRNCETTYYAGKDFATDRSRLVGAHLLLVAAKGYHRGISIGAGPLHSQIVPIVAPGLRLGPLRMSVLAPHTYHLSIEARL